MKSVLRRARDRRFPQKRQMLLPLQREVAAQDVVAQALPAEVLEVTALQVPVAQEQELKAAGERLKVVRPGDVAVVVAVVMRKAARQFDVRVPIPRSLPALRRST